MTAAPPITRNASSIIIAVDVVVVKPRRRRGSVKLNDAPAPLSVCVGRGAGPNVPVLWFPVVVVVVAPAVVADEVAVAVVVVVPPVPPVGGGMLEVEVERGVPDPIPTPPSAPVGLAPAPVVSFVPFAGAGTPHLAFQLAIPCAPSDGSANQHWPAAKGRPRSCVHVGEK